MLTGRARGAGGLIVAASLLSACASGPSDLEIAASETAAQHFAGCALLAEDVVEALQDYVDQFAPAGEIAGPDTAVPSADGLAASAEQWAARRAALGCEAREMSLLLGRELGSLEARGPLAGAVAAQVRDEVLPTTGPPPSVTVAPGDDLAAAVHEASPDALVRLEPGEHVLDDPLVLLRDTRLVGAGSGETTITSRAAGSVIVHGAGAELRLEGLTLEHVGDEPASVLVLASDAYDLEDVVLRGGTSTSQGGSGAGWGLVLGAGTDAGAQRVEQATPPAGRLTDVTVIGNAAGGAVVAGTAAPTAVRLVARDNGGCGLCATDRGGGTFEDVTVTGNTVGVLLADDAAPSITGVLAEGNSDVGVVVEGDAAPVLVDVEARDNGSVGLLLRGGDATVRDVAAAGHDRAGVVVEGASAPTLEGLALSNAAVGLVVRGSASPAIVDAVIVDVQEAHVVWGEDAAGSAAGVVCRDDVPGIVLLDRAAPELGGDACAAVDQRST